MTTKDRTPDPIEPRPKLHVLFVEDSPRDVKLTARVLEKAGYHLEFAAVDSPELFQEQLKKADPQIIICDYNLRGWTERDALEIARKLEKDIPFVVVSGSLGDEAAVECIKKGAMDYVLKDRMARLPSAVRRVLEEKATHDQRKQAETAPERVKARENLPGHHGDRTEHRQQLPYKLAVVSAGSRRQTFGGILNTVRPAHPGDRQGIEGAQ
jgi:DNA-binding NtrC family response regulator